jgi:beta-galactosidase
LGRLAAVAVAAALAGFVIEPEWKMNNHRSVTALNEAWRFHVGDVDGAEALAFDDAAWSTVDIPHDWSIAGPRAVDAPAGMGGGFVPTGVGWYRRVFVAPHSWKKQRVWIEFEGVYADAQVWLNGHLLGRQPYGYTSFRFDLSPHLRAGADNVLAVRVDNSAQPGSRWYSGSGIYRPVWIETVDPVHVAPRGVFVSTTEASEQRAIVRVLTTLRNDTDRRRKARLETRVLTPRDAEEPAIKVAERTIAARSEIVVEQLIPLKQPNLWSPEEPTLHTLVSRVTSGKDIVDVVETSFGVRTLRVSAERGFELNGHTIKLNGANVHHDHGPLGAASHGGAEFRRVQLLKVAGFNAVRTAHNLPAPAFLEACDRLGLLVMDEAFDCWEKGKNPGDYARFFKDWWQRDLDAMVLRDRNHPSVVLWSIGNEVNERGLPEGLPIAQKLAARVRELDPTRPVSCGWNFPWGQAEWVDMDPMFAAVDVAGINYEHTRHADDHARVPDRVMLATETFQSATFAAWAVVHDNPWFIGDFVWSGIDYLGESGIGRAFPPGEKVFQHWETNHWPWYGAYCGDIDITGWRKPISHYRNIVWDRGERLYMAVQEPPPTDGAWQPTLWAVPPALDSWTWPGREGRQLTVEVYSRHDSVRLFLNDRLLAEKPTTRAEEFKATFAVPYEPGTLRAVGVKDGKDAETFVLETAGPAVGVRLRPDYAATTLESTSPTFLVAEIVDKQGRVVPTSAASIDFAVSGKGASVLAVATGGLTSPEPYVAKSRRAWHGRALVVVGLDATWWADPQAFTVTATVPELGGATHTVTVESSVVILSP